MFPRPWYGATFYANTYWPRPGVRIRDALLQDFLVIAAETRAVPLEADPVLVTIPARASASTVEAIDRIVVDRPDRFVLVQR